MKRLLASAVVLGVLVAAYALSRPVPEARPETVASGGLRVQADARNPWNHLKLNNAASTFRFAVVSDRTGGARPGVFERAVEQLNWLQPEFVVCVGDLIQGNTEDVKKAGRQWQEFRGLVGRLEMPFFYLPGNHDLGNRALENLWRAQLGRRYYHFVYKDVLFLMLDTEDPPGRNTTHFGTDQLRYARNVLAAERQARWTFVLLHRPVWTYPDAAKTGWPEIERALAGRPYTVLAGHKHRYQRFVRNGRHYYILATTGGHSRLRGPAHGEFDHILWVTMKREGPVLANLLVDGIYPEDVAGDRRLKKAR
jgi:hypothetical protein